MLVQQTPVQMNNSPMILILLAPSDSDSSDDAGGGGTDIANQYNKQNVK